MRSTNERGEQTNTLFVGGPRHGRVIPGQPEKEGELYRVPALSKKDEPTDYKAANIILTFPHPVTGEPTGDTYAGFIYCTPELYPDNPQRQATLQQGLTDALLRQYLFANGVKTSGGPDGVAEQRKPLLVAWCAECLAIGDPESLPDGTDFWPQEVEFASLKDRAGRMIEHQRTTGHTARWEDRTKE